jgi:carbamoyl-phosphate synthase large subunit
MKNWRTATIAITGVNARAENPGPGCAVARCIREHTEFKGKIIGLGYDALDAGLYARDLCDQSFLLPYPSSGEDALLQRIKDIQSIEPIDAIIPCLDSEMQSFSRLKKSLSKSNISLFIPSRDQFNLRAKNNLFALCKEIGVRVPETKTVTDPSFFDRCADEGWGYPLIVKGIYYDAIIVYSAFDAHMAFSKLIGTWGYPCIVQKLVQGDELNLAGVGDGNGNLLSSVMMRKRAVTDKGKAWAGVSVVDKSLERLAAKLVNKLAWQGPLEVEVIKAPDGKIYLIEINPRFPSWIYLSHAVGRNLPVTLLKLMCGEKELELAPPSSGTFFIRHAQELIVQLQEFESMMVLGGTRQAPILENTDAESA